MATTTNFGWTTPNDIDLVKDGAAAIRTALNGVDTSFVDLKGGTTGQVLAKATNTDLDFSWVAQDDSNAIQNAIVDAKGDLIAASAADTPARLAVGSNGQVLVADSTASTGLKWATPASGGKVLQVVSAVYSTEFVTTSTTYADTGLTATITPTSASSKILVLVAQNGVGNNSGSAGKYFLSRILRAGLEISVIETLGGYGSTTTSLNMNGSGLNYLDEPATTSATIYKVQMKSSASGSDMRAQWNGGASSITLLEIGA